MLSILQYTAQSLISRCLMINQWALIKLGGVNYLIRNKIIKTIQLKERTGIRLTKRTKTCFSLPHLKQKRIRDLSHLSNIDTRRSLSSQNLFRRIQLLPILRKRLWSSRGQEIYRYVRLVQSNSLSSKFTSMMITITKVLSLWVSCLLINSKSKIWHQKRYTRWRCNR